MNMVKLEFDEENLRDQALDQQQMMIGSQLLVLARFKAQFKGELSGNAANLEDRNLNKKWIADILHVRDERSSSRD